MDMVTTVLKIEGMSCGHCKKSVEDALRALAGVQSVDVELANGTATVAHDPAQTGEHALKEAVQAVGYDVI